MALQALLLWILCPCVSFPLDTAELPVIQTTIIAHCCQPKGAGAVWQKSAGLPVVSGCRTYRKPNCAVKQSCVFCPATKSPLSQPRKLIALYKSKRPDQANGGYAIRILLNCSWSQNPASSYTYIYKLCVPLIKFIESVPAKLQGDTKPARSLGSPAYLQPVN